MTKILIIGGGAMGSAFTIPCLENNNSVKAELDTWYHLAATYSETSDSLRLYVNGTLVSEAAISPTHSIKTTSNYNYLCRGQNGEYFNGTIDNLAIWQRALQPHEIRLIYEESTAFDNFYNFHFVLFFYFLANHSWRR